MFLIDVLNQIKRAFENIQCLEKTPLFLSTQAGEDFPFLLKYDRRYFLVQGTAFSCESQLHFPAIIVQTLHDPHLDKVVGPTTDARLMGPCTVHNSLSGAASLCSKRCNNPPFDDTDVVSIRIDTGNLIADFGSQAIEPEGDKLEKIELSQRSYLVNNSNVATATC